MIIGCDITTFQGRVIFTIKSLIRLQLRPRPNPLPHQLFTDVATIDPIFNQILFFDANPWCSIGSDIFCNSFVVVNFSICKWIVIKFQIGKRQIEKWDKLHSEQNPWTSSLEVTWGTSAWLLQAELICSLQLYSIRYGSFPWIISEPSKTMWIALTDVS